MTADSIVSPNFAGKLSAADLDHEVWSKCGPIQIASLWSGEAARVERHAEVRVCWTDEQLVVRFDCRQHELLVVAAEPNREHKTIGLWDRDVCEVFLAPDLRNIKKYFEFEAAPTGEWIDLGLEITPTGRVTDWDYESKMTTASRLERVRLLLAIAIPWSDSIPRPERGDEWRANFFRCISLDPEERYLAWRPTYAPEPNFHVPEAFGRLLFS